MQAHLGLLTYNGWQENEEIVAQDCQIVDKLNDLGLKTTLQAWDVSFNPKQFTHAIPKSTWNYYLHLDRFQNFLHNLAENSVVLINPLDRILFSLSKDYLFEIGKIFSILDTELYQANKPLKEYYNKWQCSALVLKPIVSAGAYRTYLIKQEENHATTLRAIGCSQEQFLIQPFYQEIKQGELSFIFFNNEFSHAAKKVPHGSDFRSQPEHGGSLTLVKPQAEFITYAQEVVNTFAKGCFYARLDALVVNNKLKIIELELVEPSLYLENEKLLESYCQNLLAYLNLEKRK